MPVRQMTEEESERIFGSGFIIFGMKRPSRSANQYVAGHTQEQVTGTPRVITRGADYRREGIAESVPRKEQVGKGTQTPPPGRPPKSFRSPASSALHLDVDE